jgi:hypothetical protein
MGGVPGERESSRHGKGVWTLGACPSDYSRRSRLCFDNEESGVAQPAKRLCIYCGRPVGRVKHGEHIVPQAIGGGRTIKTVCADCNNAFSEIDTELCSRSPLSIVASQEIDSHIWQVWDVDHSAGNLLLEARPDWSADSLRLYPQVVFEPRGPQIRGDYEEILHFGRESFRRVLIRTMLRAFLHHKAGEKRWLHFERVEPAPEFFLRYRLPPRVFSRRPICELAERLIHDRPASFVVRYRTEAEARSTLNAVDNLSPRMSFDRLEAGVGSRLPTLRYSYDGAKALRALAKIAINILSAYCPNTPVCRGAAGFHDVIRVVTGVTPVSLELFRSNGFIHASDIEPIKSEDRGHSFRLLHMDGHWHIYSSFFGGRVGSFLRFPAPNGEQWCQADIQAPIESRDWKAATGRIIQPLTVRVEWEDPTRIMPSVEVLNVKTELKVTREPGR